MYSRLPPATIHAAEAELNETITVNILKDFRANAHHVITIKNVTSTKVLSGINLQMLTAKYSDLDAVYANGIPVPFRLEQNNEIINVDLRAHGIGPNEQVQITFAYNSQTLVNNSLGLPSVFVPKPKLNIGAYTGRKLIINSTAAGWVDLITIPSPTSETTFQLELDATAGAFVAVPAATTVGYDLAAKAPAKIYLPQTNQDQQLSILSLTNQEAGFYEQDGDELVFGKDNFELKGLLTLKYNKQQLVRTDKRLSEALGKLPNEFSCAQLAEGLDSSSYKVTRAYGFVLPSMLQLIQGDIHSWCEVTTPNGTVVIDPVLDSYFGGHASSNIGTFGRIKVATLELSEKLNTQPVPQIKIVETRATQPAELAEIKAELPKTIIAGERYKYILQATNKGDVPIKITKVELNGIALANSDNQLLALPGNNSWTFNLIIEPNLFFGGDKELQLTLATAGQSLTQPIKVFVTSNDRAIVTTSAMTLILLSIIPAICAAIIYSFISGNPILPGRKRRKRKRKYLEL